nr:MAG TPA: protein of unknown function (DUF4314) [Caudoviricetes sp.]
MYEQYTDKQIVEMLKPKLTKILGDGIWDAALEHSESGRNLIELIATIYRSAYIRGQLGRSFIIGEPKQTKHWVPATKDNVKVGSKVRMIDEEGHRNNPQWFPNVGTVGTVTEVGFHTHLVQWPEGTTSGTDEWYCDDTRLEVLLCE